LACGAGGNAFHFVMEHDLWILLMQLKHLPKMLAWEVPRERRNRTGTQQNAELLKALSESAQFYQSNLPNTTDKKKATDYL